MNDLPVTMQPDWQDAQREDVDQSCYQIPGWFVIAGTASLIACVGFGIAWAIYH